MIQLLLQRVAIFGEEIGVGALAAAQQYAIALDEIALIALFEIAKTRNERITAHQPGLSLPIAGFGHGCNHRNAVHLVNQIVAHHAAGVGDPGVQQQASAFEEERARWRESGWYCAVRPRDARGPATSTALHARR